MAIGAEKITFVKDLIILNYLNVNFGRMPASNKISVVRNIACDGIQ